MAQQEPPRTWRYRRVSSIVQISILSVALTSLVLWLWLSGTAESFVTSFWAMGEDARAWSRESVRYPWE